jgi:hypothetical protein
MNNAFVLKKNSGQRSAVSGQLKKQKALGKTERYRRFYHE